VLLVASIVCCILIVSRKTIRNSVHSDARCFFLRVGVLVVVNLLRMGISDVRLVFLLSVSVLKKIVILVSMLGYVVHVVVLGKISLIPSAIDASMH